MSFTKIYKNTAVFKEVGGGDGLVKNFLFPV